jgi:hypothetical protein
VNDLEELASWAQSTDWGFIDFPRGRVLFMRLNLEQVVLVEPDGGYFYPSDEPIHLIQMPDAKILASALSGVSAFTSQPRTMSEIEAQFQGVEAWRLRRLGFLSDVGRKQRRIVSRWVGYDLSQMVHYIFESSKTGTRKINSD